MMLRDQHDRINTTSLRNRKLSPYQKPAISVAITKFKAITLRHTKSIFLMTSDTLPSTSGYDP